jgi:hypothetical protein
MTSRLAGLLAVGFALAASDAPLSAQPSPAVEPADALTLAVGAGAPLSEAARVPACTEGGSASAAVGYRRRFRRFLVAEGTASLESGVTVADCVTVPLGPGEHHLPFYDDDPDHGTLATAVRAGVEGGAPGARLRGLVGLGRMWGRGGTYGTAAASLTLGQGAVRFVAAVEARRYSLAVSDRFLRIDQDLRVIDDRTVRGRRVRERPVIAQVGIELPIGGGR